MQAFDRLPRHSQVFFGSGFERVHHIKQARLDHHYSHGDAVALIENEAHVGPIFHFHAAAARAAEEGQLHAAGVDAADRAAQIAHQLIGAGKTDLGILDAKSSHALQQHHRVGH